MPTPALPAAALLGLMRLASPSLPVGGFSYSEALEAAVDAGRVADEAQAGDWLLDQLMLGIARADLPAAAAAFEHWRCGDLQAIERVNSWLRTTRETAELRQQAEQTGRSLAAWLRNGEHAADPRVAQLAALTPAPAWPVAYALAALLAGAPRHEAMLAFTWAWAENQVQAAVRTVPLGQSAGQRVLARLAAAIPATVDEALARPESCWQAYLPMLAILSSRHETQYSRLFRS